METRRLLYVLSSGRSQVRAARALRFFLRSSPAASSHMQAYSATLRTRARSADCLTITGCRGRASQLSGSLIGLYYLSGQHLALSRSRLGEQSVAAHVDGAWPLAARIGHKSSSLPCTRALMHRSCRTDANRPYFVTVRDPVADGGGSHASSVVPTRARTIAIWSRTATATSLSLARWHQYAHVTCCERVQRRLFAYVRHSAIAHARDEQTFV